MAEQIFLGVLGLCAGFTVASGMVGLIIGLSIVPRYAGITRTADKILLYEDFTMLGATLGNMAMVFQWHLPGGQILLAIFGIFAGVFMGSWILALCGDGESLSNSGQESKTDKRATLDYCECGRRQGDRRSIFLL